MIDTFQQGSPLVAPQSHHRAQHQRFHSPGPAAMSVPGDALPRWCDPTPAACIRFSGVSFWPFWEAGDYQGFEGHIHRPGPTLTPDSKPKRLWRWVSHSEPSPSRRPGPGSKFSQARAQRSTALQITSAGRVVVRERDQTGEQWHGSSTCSSEGWRAAGTRSRETERVRKWASIACL